MKLINEVAILILVAQVISPDLQPLPPLEIQEHQIRAANVANHEYEHIFFLKCFGYWIGAGMILEIIKLFAYMLSPQYGYFHIPDHLHNHSMIIPMHQHAG